MFSSKYNYKFAHGSYWLLIFYHNAENETLFDDLKEAENCNVENKFSILNEINSNFFKKSAQNSFEFLLEYPKEFPSDYIRWSQTQSPLYENEVKDVLSAKGFKPIHVSSSFSDFTGLVSTTIDNSAGCRTTLLDGSVGVRTWYYSIGMYSTCESKYGGKKPPGPPGHEVSEIYLWLRAPFIPRITVSISYRIKFSYLILITLISI